MKTELINTYSFDELSEEVKRDVLAKEAEIEAEIVDEGSPFYDLALKMERMQTPWFLASEIYHKHKDYLIEAIKVNEYQFTKQGKRIFIHENELL